MGVRRVGLYQGLGLAIERALSEARGEPDVEFDATDVRIRELARLHSGAEVDAWREDPTSPVPFSPLAVRRLWLGRIVTFHFVCVGWVVFFAGTVTGGGIDTAVDVFAALGSGWTQAPELLNPLVAVVIVLTIAVQFLRLCSPANSPPCSPPCLHRNGDRLCAVDHGGRRARTRRGLRVHLLPVLTWIPTTPSSELSAPGNGVKSGPTNSSGQLANTT